MIKAQVKFLLLLCFTLGLYGCKDSFEYKTSLRAVSTLEIFDVTQTAAVVSAKINTDNNAPIQERGICYSLTENPTASGSKKVDLFPGEGDFSCNISNLEPGRIYYVKAYATNSYGTAYGNEMSFTTKDATVPILNPTASISSITSISARSGGEVTNSGASEVVGRGVCWSSSNALPTISDSKTVDGKGVGQFVSSLSDLKPFTRFYVRSYATNSVGTGYGEVKEFSTSQAVAPGTPSVSTPTLVTMTTALSGGIITNDGGSAVTARGVCWSSSTTTPTVANTRTTDGAGIGSYTSSLTGLTANTTYYLRAYAVNAIGTSYSGTITFRTLSATLASISTITPSGLTFNSAVSGGSITSEGGSSVTARGVCWSNTTSSPTLLNSSTSSGSGAGNFSSSITGLLASTTYYVRAYATNSVGTAYGATTSFTTSSSPLAVGQSYLGGVIAYIFQQGDAGFVQGQIHGLITTVSNLSAGSQWGCSGTLTGASSAGLGSGSNNTSVITTRCSSSLSAAYICFNYVSGGYSDWYLPSREELYKLYLNRVAIKNFNSAYYWSSTENNSTTAFSVDFSSGTQVAGSSKTNSFYVRPVRVF